MYCSIRDVGRSSTFTTPNPNVSKLRYMTTNLAAYVLEHVQGFRLLRGPIKVFLSIISLNCPIAKIKDTYSLGFDIVHAVSHLPLPLLSRFLFLTGTHLNESTFSKRSGARNCLKVKP